MADQKQKQGKSGKRARTPKTSKGERRGAKPTQLSAVQKVLMGKGMYQAFKRIGAGQR